jgi:curli production assembly/transport component CsgG
VKEAIDAAVMHLTVQGIKNNLWRLKNPADWNSALIQRYLAAENSEVTTVTPRQAADTDAAAAPVQTQ